MLYFAAAKLLESCRSADVRLAAAESCTGGLIAAALTEIPGSSDIFECGFVTYANEAKTRQLGVPAALIAEKGAVSREVAAAMAEGVLSHSRADLAVAVTGIAGPGGGTETKPVGTVHMAVARRGKEPVCYHDLFEGDRRAVREQAVLAALSRLEESVLGVS